MRLELLITELKRNFRYIALSAVVGGVLGILMFYYLPLGYRATGSLFVARRPDLVQREEFTYEGYYAERTASDYTNTVIGILESSNLRKNVLEMQGLAVTEKNIRELRKSIEVRKKAPQLVYLKIKAETKAEAENLWGLVSGEAIRLSRELNRLEGDPNLSVQVLGEPLVTAVYKDLVIFSTVGFLTGAFVSILVIFGKSRFI